MIMIRTLYPLTVASALCTILQTPLVADAQNLVELSLGASAGTRLLVVAPHPDDETLAAGGLIQRVRVNGGSVRVVVVTSGDALRQGVEIADRTTTPTPNDFRRYGRLRELESERAVAALGLNPEHITFSVSRTTACAASRPDTSRLDHRRSNRRIRTGSNHPWPSAS